jgi:hypothetical protein
MIGLAFSFNLWFPSVAKWYVAHQSGFRLTIEESKCAPYRGLVDFHNVEIKNPEKMFSQEGCLKISRLMAKANLLTVFNPEIIFEDIIIDVDRVICDTNGRGEINILNLMEAFAKPKENELEPIKKLKKDSRERKKYPVKVASHKLPKEESLKFFAIREGSQCVARKMVVYIGKFELHNMTKEGENREIKIDEMWSFSNVRSQSEVIEAIKVRLQRHGVGLVIQNTFEAIFNLPGVKPVTHLIKGISRFSQGFFKGVAESMMKILPSKAEVNPEPNLSEIINPVEDEQLPEPING